MFIRQFCNSIHDVNYVSNTLAAGGNQNWFSPENSDDEYRCRSYFKVFAGGCYNYTFQFSDVIDSTYADGSHSWCNLSLGGWRITQAQVGICATCLENAPQEPAIWVPLQFNGETSVAISSGDEFFCDPIRLDVPADFYLCIELVFYGTRIPCFTERIVPTFRYHAGSWVPSPEVPLPGFIGCNRAVKAEIGFLGDSITQGIGTPNNAYSHYSAVVSKQLGTKYAFGIWVKGSDVRPMLQVRVHGLKRRLD